MPKCRGVFIWLMAVRRITSIKRTNRFLIISQSGLNDTVAYAYLYFWDFLKIAFFLLVAEVFI